MSKVYLCPICDYEGISADIIEHFKSKHNENFRENRFAYTRSKSCKPLDIYLIFAFGSCFVVRSGYSTFTRKFTDNVQMIEDNDEVPSKYIFSVEVQSKKGTLIKRKTVNAYNFCDLSNENSITINTELIEKSFDTLDNLKFVLSITEMKENERKIPVKISQEDAAHILNKEQSDNATNSANPVLDLLTSNFNQTTINSVIESNEKSVATNIVTEEHSSITFDSLNTWPWSNGRNNLNSTATSTTNIKLSSANISSNSENFPNLPSTSAQKKTLKTGHFLATNATSAGTKTNFRNSSKDSGNSSKGRSENYSSKTSSARDSPVSNSPRSKQRKPQNFEHVRFRVVNTRNESNYEFLANTSTRSTVNSNDISSNIDSVVAPNIEPVALNMTKKSLKRFRKKIRKASRSAIPIINPATGRDVFEEGEEEYEEEADD